jgi:NAD(P)-dependent dehydrogenase (short-subunit alcohol dehydrogenase family)
MIIQDKVVIVTGVGPGMGRKLCLHAAEEGARVVVTARSQAFIDGVVDEIRTSGGKAIAVRCDVADNDDCERVAAATVAEYGRIDGLVNSAHRAGDFVPFEDSDFADWRASFEVTLFGALQMTKAVLPHMKANGGGSIVNIGTMETRKPIAQHTPYILPKAALQAATRSLAVEFGRYKIRVNSAVMGWMWGSPVESYFQHEAAQQGVTVESLTSAVSSGIALGHIPTDSDCAKTVLMLLSDYTSEVTGASFDINGGEFLPQ